MSRQKRAILGIEIHTDEIRVAELRRTGAGFTVAGVRSQALPSGAMDGGVVARPELVAEALNKVFERIGASTRDAIVGLPAQAVTMRVIDVPQVPGSEMRMVVEGEMKHFEILREQGGVYDFLPMGAGSETENQVLLMAVEESIVNGYREVASRAGLQVDGMEPLHIGMYRAAHSQIAAQPSTLFLAITEVCTEIGFVVNDQLSLYRRVDTGTSDLLERSKDSGEGTLTNALSTEMKRSLDYFHRQFPSAPAIKRIILAVSEPKLGWLRDKLVEALKVDVEFAQIPSAAAGTPQMIDELAPPGGLQYVGAIGLAMKGVMGDVPGVPSFDLTARLGGSYEIKLAQKALSTSIAVTIAMAVIGAATWFFVHGKVVNADDELKANKAALADRQARFLPEMERQTAEFNAAEELRKQGIPFQPAMDAVAEALSPNAGLISIQFDEANHIRIVGEALTEEAIFRTAEGLRAHPVFANCTVDTFDRGATGDNGIRFEISSQYVGFPVGSQAPAPGPSSKTPNSQSPATAQAP